MLLFAATAPAVLTAQDPPLAVSGTFATGYYTTVTRGEANQSLNFVPVGAKFDVSAYLLSRDLIDISAQPELNYGPQASEAGFQGGNGITLRVTFLRRGITPVTFRYSNVQLEDVYFGSLTQLSGYTLKNRNKDLGITWQFKPPKLPAITVDWGLNSVDSQPGIANLPDYMSTGNHVNVDGHYERWGWNMDGYYHRQEQTSNLLATQIGVPQTGSLMQTVGQSQLSARREFWRDSELYIDGGTQSTASVLITLPINLTTNYANVNLRLFQKRRFKTSVRAGYSSNLASQLLAQAASTLTAPGSTAPGGDILLPYSRGLSSFNLNAITNYNLNYGWSLYAGIEKNQILSANDNGQLSADYFTTSAGVLYAHSFPWGNLSGEYGREFGIGSVTGQSGTIQGQTYRVGAQTGKGGGLVFDGSVHGSDQSVQNVQPISNRSLAVEGSVSSRIVGSFNARIGGGWQWGDVVNSANDFRSNGYTARIGIEHPRYQVSFSLNNTDSNSLPFYSQLLGLPVVGIALSQPLMVIPSDYRSFGFSLHANPLRKVEVSALWTRSKQHLDGVLSNDFDLINVYVTYHFRRIQIEAGFIHSNQVFTNYPDTIRQRFYIRFLRNARLL
jgi:hypothetical protein